MSSSTRTTLEDLNLTNDEAKRLGEAMKDETFRKMLIEYAEEISDPENRKRYEAEITQMENERGMDISFVNPEPGYVIKTSVNGETKVFINVCQSKNIGKPTSQRQASSSGQKGLQWSIPHSFSPCRNDVDNKGAACQVYDVVFHPDTYRMAETNDRFRKLVNDTAIDGIQKQFNVQLDRNNVKFPKLKFKGKPSSTVIRRRKNDCDHVSNPDTVGDFNMPYPYDNMTTEEKSAIHNAEIEAREKKNQENNSKTTIKNINKTSVNNDCMKNNVDGNEKNNKIKSATEPKYSITHRSEIDLQDFRDARDAKVSTRPKELVIAIELPLLSCSASVCLDIFEKRLCLESVKPAAYKLDLDLPYPVDETLGSAKFDKAKHRLTVTLPVIPSVAPKLSGLCISDEDNTNEKEETMLNDVDGDRPSLIEVISETTNEDGVNKNVDVNENSSHVENLALSKDTLEKVENCGMADESKDIWDDKEEKSDKEPVYNMPHYKHRQDSETVSIVLEVKNVLLDSVVKLFPLTNSFQVRFVSMGSGFFPMYYSFVIQFTSECPIVMEHTSVDVSDNNIAVVFLKARKSRKQWDRFYCGVSPELMKEVLFVTDKNLVAQLNQLEQEAVDNQRMIQDQSQSSENDVEVTEMSDKQLTIKIKKSRKKNKKKRNNSSMSTTEDENDEDIVDDGPTSADIQVVCDHSRKLHGILKARSRSFSESSDDIGSVYSRENTSTSQMSESPISETDEIVHEEGLKKTVSFDSHVDKTTFKSNMTINMLHSSLKTKRRNARKRQEKREEKRLRKRNRHNSNDSQCSSSGDELCFGRTKRDSESCCSDSGEAGGEVEATGKSKKVKRTKEKNSKGDADCGNKQNVCGATRDGVVVDTICNDVSHGEAVSGVKVKEEFEPQDVGGEVSLANGDGTVGEGCVTSCVLSSEVMDSKEKDINENFGDETASSDTIKKNHLSPNCGLKLAKCRENVENLTRNEDCDSSKLDSDDDTKACDSGQLGAADASNQSRNCPINPNTALSWDEEPRGINQQDFATKCAFEFTNSMIYELDDD